MRYQAPPHKELEVKRPVTGTSSYLEQRLMHSNRRPVELEAIFLLAKTVKVSALFVGFTLRLTDRILKNRVPGWIYCLLPQPLMQQMFTIVWKHIHIVDVEHSHYASYMLCGRLALLDCKDLSGACHVMRLFTHAERPYTPFILKSHLTLVVEPYMHK